MLDVSACRRLTEYQDALCGELYQGVEFGRGIEYEALSYRWSDFDHENPTYIEIDEEKVPIGPDLHEALKHFRHQLLLPRVLWIDQICIDQANEKEKLTQIRIMSDLTRRLSRCLCGLGLATSKVTWPWSSFPS